MTRCCPWCPALQQTASASRMQPCSSCAAQGLTPGLPALLSLLVPTRHKPVLLTRQGGKEAARSNEILHRLIVEAIEDVAPEVRCWQRCHQAPIYGSVA